jgi:hypothetical protein
VIAVFALLVGGMLLPDDINMFSTVHLIFVALGDALALGKISSTAVAGDQVAA